MKELWVEKYRPKSLDEVVGQEEIVERLKAYAKTGNLPHLLFAGPAGTGKTTCAIALARDMFGEDWRQNYFELNSSDERGIDTVRTKVKEIARLAPFGGTNFKIIFLDEADNLRRTPRPPCGARWRRIRRRPASSCPPTTRRGSSSRFSPARRSSGSARSSRRQSPTTSDASRRRRSSRSRTTGWKPSSTSRKGTCDAR